jgi:hypothetical protein
MAVKQVDPQLYADLFEVDKRGQVILEELIRRFARPAVKTGGIDAVLQTYHRDGARSVVEFITARINMAHGVEIENEDETRSDG